MTLNAADCRELLKKCELQKLFVEKLGWDRPGGNLSVAVDGHRYELKELAQKRGVHILLCPPDTSGAVPEYGVRRKIEKQVSRLAYEHLLIFVDRDQKTQIWQWVARQPGAPAQYREHPFHPGTQTGDALLQKLNHIYFTLDEEEALDLTGTVHRLRDAFDRDRITKRFYDRFKSEHATFLDFIKGITEQGDRTWYASLMLNRLMFVYFIQQKGFLDGKHDYLRDRLQKTQARKGKGKFHSFYRYFLLSLFHEGFAKQESDRELDADLKELLGHVPYLNGGLFDVHELERNYPKVDVPDEAFEQLFDFFDQYEWHLDTRPLRDDREINPDVLGYIFEKYINQKQMGAYYTKEDITEYISKNTIIPYLFDAARKDCAVAFEPNSPLWRLLQDEPDKYIYPAVRHGVVDDTGAVIPLPEAIEAGVADVSKREGWNRPASTPFALPTETWREHVARRQRCLELRRKLASGEIHKINELITHNLDIRQFAEDCIAECEGPELLRAFWHAIRDVTVLDPTCGSGAFLFAALGILEPLYEACLDRMRAFIEDAERAGGRRIKNAEIFRAVLADVDRHPNRDYFILKSIIVHNLYGVDIMEEAVEICKLRLFLKLVAQVENIAHLEPLPDIDFNIRAGNTLVGFSTLGDVKRTVLGGLVDDALRDEVDRIVEEAETVDRAFRLFHEMQTRFDMNPREFASAKQTIKERLSSLSTKLDRLLAGDFGVFADAKPKVFREWCKVHQPFHWFAEFYGIMNKGGFSVAIGNPPYVEVPQSFSRDLLRRQYRTVLERWSRDEDLYTLVIERSLELLDSGRGGRLGLILPLSVSFSTKRPFQQLRKTLASVHAEWWWSHFDRIPSALFGNEVRTRCTIAISGVPVDHNRMRHTTSLQRWTADSRPALFSLLRYSTIAAALDLTTGIPKVGTQIQAEALSEIMLTGSRLEGDLQNAIPFSALAAAAPDFPQPCVFVGGTAYNWFPVWRDIPETTDIRGKPSLPARTAAFRFKNEDAANVVFALLASSLGYWWWAVASDGFNLKKWLLDRFPVSLEDLSDEARKELTSLGRRLRKELRSHYVYKDNRGRIGNYFLPACSACLADIDSAIARHLPALSDDFFSDVRASNESFSRAAVQIDADDEENE